MTKPASYETRTVGVGLRDYFAAAALQGLIAIARDGAIPSVVVSSDLAYKYADAMLKERERGE